MLSLDCHGTRWPAKEDSSSQKVLHHSIAKMSSNFAAGAESTM
jgi:hypothetical protein